MSLTLSPEDIAALAREIAPLIAAEIRRPEKGSLKLHEAARYVNRPPSEKTGDCSAFYAWCKRYGVKKAHGVYPIRNLDAALSRQEREASRKPSNLKAS